MRTEHELDNQKKKIIDALSIGSTREDFWYGKTADDYPHMLDVQFQKNPDLAVWMDKRRIDQQWVCHECGVQFGSKNCGKCPIVETHCMEKGCKIECEGCTNNQEHYLGDYQMMLKARYWRSDESWVTWAETSLQSLTLDDEGLPIVKSREVYKIKRSPQAQYLEPFDGAHCNPSVWDPDIY